MYFSHLQQVEVQSATSSTDHDHFSTSCWTMKEDSTTGQRSTVMTTHTNTVYSHEHVPSCLSLCDRLYKSGQSDSTSLFCTCGEGAAEQFHRGHQQSGGDLEETERSPETFHPPSSRGQSCW